MKVFKNFFETGKFVNTTFRVMAPKRGGGGGGGGGGRGHAALRRLRTSDPLVWLVVCTSL